MLFWFGDKHCDVVGCRQSATLGRIDKWNYECELMDGVKI